MMHFVWESSGNYARVHQTQRWHAPLGLSSARKDGTLSDESLSESETYPTVLATVFNIGSMAPRSKAHKQRLNALAQVENPGRKKTQPPPDSSSQLPVIGPRGGASKWTAIWIQAPSSGCIPAFTVTRVTSAFPFSDPITADHKGDYAFPRLTLINNLGRWLTES
jgi:hypothetical protein